MRSIGGTHTTYDFPVYLVCLLAYFPFLCPLIPSLIQSDTNVALFYVSHFLVLRGGLAAIVLKHHIRTLHCPLRFS